MVPLAALVSSDRIMLKSKIANLEQYGHLIEHLPLAPLYTIIFSLEWQGK
jgi:hypothetical protein